MESPAFKSYLVIKLTLIKYTHNEISSSCGCCDSYRQGNGEQLWCPIPLYLYSESSKHLQWAEVVRPMINSNNVTPWHGVNCNVRDNIGASRSWKKFVKVFGHQRSKKGLLMAAIGDSWFERWILCFILICISLWFWTLAQRWVIIASIMHVFSSSYIPLTENSVGIQDLG